MERKWWTLIVVCVATFMLLLDITIVNVALPKIAVDLHSSFSDIQWVIDAYALTLASVLLTTGAMADLLGRKLVFTVGVGMFSLASLLCGLSPSSLFLIVARGLQGLGGAVMFSTSLALLAQEFHGRDRGTAFGVWGATIGASAAVGPLLGGGLTQGFGWQSIFFINVPVGVLTIALTLAKVAESRDPAGKRVDWVGTVTFTAALFLLVFAIIRSNVKGWGNPVIVAMLIGAGVLLTAFLISQVVQPHAMFDLSLFRKPTFSGVSIAAMALSAGMFAMFLYLTLYLQTILGFSPLQTGLRFLPFTVLSFFVAGVGGKLTATAPARLLLFAGLLLTGVGLFLMRGLGANSGWTALLPGFLVAGAGVGLTNPALASTAIGVVPPQRSGMASGINSTFRQLGTATGIAVLGAIFESQLSGKLAPSLAGTPVAHSLGKVAHAIAGGAAPAVLHGVPAGFRARASVAVHAAFAGALNDILLVGAVVAVVGAVLALVLVRGQDFAVYGREGAPEAAVAAG
ncbi:MAG TPA: MFS transporter [Solirubrobacteraceae bacterium]|nr:MFS transporter [Solirubrobacteraceae bacterium]